MQNGKRVLLLEDEKLLQRTFVDALMKAGYDVESAGSAAETRTLLRRPEGFDVVVLNIILPDGDGIDLCAEIRAEGVTSPILMQSGHQLEYKIGPSLRAGVNAYLEKPFTMERLVEYVDLLSNLPAMVADHAQMRGYRGRNRPDMDAFAAKMVEDALVELEAVRPLAGAYVDHPVVDGKAAPTIPFTEAQANEFQKTLLEIRDLLEHQPESVEERHKLIAALSRFCEALASWIAGRATVATDELIKHLVKAGVVVYVAHAIGLQQVALRLLAALAAQGGGH